VLSLNYDPPLLSLPVARITGIGHWVQASMCTFKYKCTNKQSPLFVYAFVYFGSTEGLHQHLNKLPIEPVLFLFLIWEALTRFILFFINFLLGYSLYGGINDDNAE
jgi:FtsH-binding integral membrane protein